jgi:retinol-binding protein 3
VLAGNIGYLQVLSFAGRVARVRAPLADAMSRLATCNAIIVDIRRNVGGIPEVVQLLSSYFFDSTPVLLGSLYWRADDRLEDFYTLRTVAGTRIGARKPLYVLISERTFSAAEGFAYDLQARRRAIIVGATSAGAAHPGHVKSIGAQFAVFIPQGRPINPITKTDWEGTGVRPDMATVPDSALAVALRHARRAQE